MNLGIYRRLNPMFKGIGLELVIPQASTVLGTMQDFAEELSLASKQEYELRSSCTILVILYSAGGNPDGSFETLLVKGNPQCQYIVSARLHYLWLPAAALDWWLSVVALQSAIDWCMILSAEFGHVQDEKKDGIVQNENTTFSRCLKVFVYFGEVYWKQLLWNERGVVMRSRPIIEYDDTESWANVDDFLNMGDDFSTPAAVVKAGIHGLQIDTLLASGGLSKNSLFIQEHADITGSKYLKDFKVISMCYTGFPIILPWESESVLLDVAILGAFVAKKYLGLRGAMKALNAAGLSVDPTTQRIADAIEAYEANQSNGNGVQNEASGNVGRLEHTARGCTYKEF
ncbi:hypothetical protein Tco_0210542 [Tanacetum coccineum]